MDESGLAAGPLRRRRAEWLGDRTFAALFAAAYLASLTELPGACPPFGPTTTASLGALFVLVGTVGFWVIERTAKLRPALAYFGLQLALGAAIVYLNTGALGSFLLVLLLCGQAARVLPRLLVAGCAGLVTCILLFSAPPLPTWPHVLQTSSASSPRPFSSSPSPKPRSRSSASAPRSIAPTINCAAPPPRPRSWPPRGSATASPARSTTASATT